MNHYFEFKKFTIWQQDCAMKVTEIACIQGAWSPVPYAAKKVLDIGSGTGLLSLMMAQRHTTIQIDALEIDEASYRQSLQNFTNSVYNTRIQAIQGDLKTFTPQQLYDFIIVNPPFFERQLKSPDQLKNIAWHSAQLTLHELVACIEKLLCEKGHFSILIPVQREKEILAISRNSHFFPIQILQIRHSDKHAISHLVIIFSRQQMLCNTELLTMKENGNYSTFFLHLLRDFYLKL